MLYGIILAGGKGERFWPQSTRKTPKQILPITSNKPMLIETVDRISQIVPRKKIIIIAGKELKPALTKLVPDVNLLLEPLGRNTACAIAYTAIKLPASSIMAIFPADHWIKGTKQFLQSINSAIEFAKKDYLVTLGIVPTRAETGYGYIETGEKLDGSMFSVKSFKEKPNQKQAQEFIRKKKFLWNSGIFVWSTQQILSAFEKYMPDFYKDLQKLKNNKISLSEFYKRAPNISVDYSIIEKAKNVVAVKSNFTWDDVGGWLALERIWTHDKSGNIKIGNVKDIATNNCIVVADKGVVATLGVSELIIVQKKNTTFVCHKNRVVDIKKLVHSFSLEKGLKKYL